jgi:ADP-heptose:LPS heptosyltransferase
MISNLKNIIKFFTYYLIDSFIKQSKVIKPNSLLLIRLDAIGDYILFRNFIKSLRNDKKYKKYSITLLGNETWRSFSEEHDHHFVDNFIWLDRSRFTKNIFYRIKKLQELVSCGYEIVINPVYSREFFIGDNIIKHINAREKIGSAGDLSNIKKWQKKISDNYYDTLIPSRAEVMFEFERNKEFFENLFDTKLDMIKLNLDKTQKRLRYELPKKYAILFIGANDSNRKWSIEKFLEAANYLNRQYGYDIVLCSTSTDNKKAYKLEKSYNGKLLNLVGKTSLRELSTVILNSELILSNETSAPHIAAALGMRNIFVISNGRSYGRFTPYPKDISKNFHVIYHPLMDKNLDNHRKLRNNYRFKSNLNIDDISFKMVKGRIDNVLTNE